MKSCGITCLIVVVGLVGCVNQSDDSPARTTKKVPMPRADLEKLEDELYRHGLAGFRRIREAHPMDRFYCFAFYTNGEFNSIALTASTYEGLEQVTQQYKSNPRYQTVPIEDLALQLKWSPCDSPLHESPADALAPVDHLVRAVAAELQRRFELEDEGEKNVAASEFEAKIKTSIANALKRIDAEGGFGRGEERSEIVLNLLMGDQSDEERIEFAERVNPPETVKMLKKDLDAAARLRQ